MSTTNKIITIHWATNYFSSCWSNHREPPVMENNNKLPVAASRKTSKARKTVSKRRSWLSRSRSEDAYSVLDMLENFIRTKPRRQIILAAIALAITLFIFLYSLFAGNVLVALIVIAVWVTTWSYCTGSQEKFETKSMYLIISKPDHDGVVLKFNHRGELIASGNTYFCSDGYSRWKWRHLQGIEAVAKMACRRGNRSNWENSHRIRIFTTACN